MSEEFVCCNCNKSVNVINRVQLRFPPDDTGEIVAMCDECASKYINKALDRSIPKIKKASISNGGDNQKYEKVALDMKHFYCDDLIASTPVDYIQNLYKQIKQAKYEAIIRGINANIIAITDKLAFTRLKYYFQDIPMILGMKCMYTDELPDDVLFSIFESPNPPLNAIEENKALKKENKKLKDMLKRISEFVDGSDYYKGADEFDL